jgi:hypothetical protein
VQVVLGCGENRRRAGRGTMENSGALPLYRGRGGGRWPVIKTEKRAMIKWGTKWLGLSEV